MLHVARRGALAWLYVPRTSRIPARRTTRARLCDGIDGGAGVTQFGRALSSLNIDILCANTPAANGSARAYRIRPTLE
jgi:hypothetical protein